MASYITKEEKENIFKNFGGDSKNTGSTEGQIALFTHRINSLSQHLRENKKDPCENQSDRIVDRNA